MPGHRRARANVLLLCASAIWGFTFVAQRLGADHVGPLTFNAVRFAMAAVFVGAIIVVLDWRRGLTRERRRAATRKAVVPGLICGLVLALAGGLQQAGMSTVTASNAAFITGLYMVLVPLAGGLLLGHKVAWPIVVGVVVAVVGLYLICVPHGLAMTWGSGLVLLSSLAWTAHILLIDHFSKRVSALRFAVAQFVGCAVVSAALSPLTDASPFTGIGQAIIPLLFCGLMAGGIAFTLQVVAQRDALAAHAALIMSLESVFGAIGGALLLGENMGLRGYVGAVLMVLGIVVSQWRTRAQRRGT